MTIPWSHGYGSAVVLGSETNLPHATATIFAIRHTWRFASGSMFCNTWRHQMQCNSQPAHCSKGGFPRVLPSMAKLLQQMCACVRTQRGCTSKMIRLDSSGLHKYLSFMAQFWQHYDTPMELYCWPTTIPQSQPHVRHLTYDVMSFSVRCW
jgi:hypothetical protein